MKLRRGGIYLGGIVSLLVVLICCYYFSYHNALRDYNQESTERNNDLVTYLNELGMGNKSEKQEIIPLDTSKETIINSDMTYTVEEYDIETNTTTTQNSKPPSKYIGLTRSELEKLLKEEMKDIPISEYQKGLISMDLIRFSEDEVVLRKCYRPNLERYKYYLAIYDGELVVYYSDKKTLYERTGIDVTSLSDVTQSQLSIGKYVRDEEELYSLLESYSS